MGAEDIFLVTALMNNETVFSAEINLNGNETMRNCKIILLFNLCKFGICAKYIINPGDIGLTLMASC